MDLLQLRYFKDAAIYENFSEVARLHMVPQSYISKTIKNLEQELGCNLFDRKGRNVSLNDKGKFFLSKVEPALSSIDEGITFFSATKKSTISLYIQAGSRFSSLIIADYLNYTKDIVLSCINQSSNNITKDSFDFTFMQLQDDMKDYTYIHLLKDNIAVAMKDTHPLAGKKLISIEELREENFVAYYSGMGLRIITDDYCIKHGFSPKVIFEVSNDTAFSYSLLTKDCLGLVPATTWSLNFSSNIRLVPLEEPLSRELVLAWSKGKQLTKEELDFKNYVINWFRNLI